MSGRESSFKSASTYKVPIFFAVRIQDSVLISNPTLNPAFSQVPVVCSERKEKKADLAYLDNRFLFLLFFMWEKACKEFTFQPGSEKLHLWAKANLRKFHSMQWSFQKLYQQEKVKNYKEESSVTWNGTVGPDRKMWLIYLHMHIHTCAEVIQKIKRSTHRDEKEEL